MVAMQPLAATRRKTNFKKAVCRFGRGWHLRKWETYYPTAFSRAFIGGMNSEASIGVHAGVSCLSVS